MKQFTHLHLHTQFSILDGATDIKKLIAKAVDLEMKAVAITDHGTMYGVKQFHDIATSNGIKPILGCEVYVVKDHLVQDKDERSGNHLILLAKNKKGYQNLIKLISIGALEGTYYGKPRVDNELVWKYHEGLIAATACIAGEIPEAILNGRVQLAEKIIQDYKNVFGDDFYLELQRHKTDDPAKNTETFELQTKVNKHLIELSEKCGVKLIATNDVHFLNAEDAGAHDILICLNTGKDINDTTRMQYTGQEYFKTPDEMYELFKDVPQALANTNEIADKIEEYELNREVILPEYPLPEDFDNQDEYLKHITYEGAKKRYPEINKEVDERLTTELTIIKNMGFAGYFLIVQDFISEARKMDVSVGPGRGSAAGSAVAYCIGITNIDPIKYKLLFERFLNPERVTMPDIDIDFDEDGRERVMKWVENKYGNEKVAQIITFGTMAAKLAIRDVARVLQLSLPEADRLAKLVPDGPKVTLKKAYKEVSDLQKEKKSENELISKTLAFAETLEGSVRQSGIHACGVIIGRDPLIEHIPLTSSKDSDLMVTQYDGKYIEDVGMLKMDFLGLKTLSIIKDAIENIHYSKGIDIDPDNIPLDDKKTFQLYQRGETVGTFQFESEGMRMHLRNLKPTNIEDLIAMNALYRPGPMDFIPLFIKRKHGVEKVEYPHKMLEGILKETYGIMVYQEQIMQTAQIMGGFSLGKADLLRRAMGKKKMDIMAKQKVVFIDGAKEQGIDPKKAEEVFNIMTEFAKYGFNRSHSAAYSVVAFQTGYLKANHPGEYMAAVLSRNLSNIKKITTFMDECRRMGLKVLGPDINESFLKFTVNKNGDIRFGLGAIKGVGENASRDIISEREENGPYKDIYDFAARVKLNSVNKKNIENLAAAGAFDSFNGIKRHQFFYKPTENDSSFIEKLIKYGNQIQGDNNSSQQNLFEDIGGMEIRKPEIPQCEEMNKLEKLNKEKDLIGIYLSAHPLDDYKLEINNYCNIRLSHLQDMNKLNGREYKVAGFVTNIEHRLTKNGKPFGSFTLEDYTDTHKFMLFSKDYIHFKSYLTVGYSLLLRGKIQTRYNSTDSEFKILNIDLLSDMKDKMIKSLALKIKIEHINNQFIEEIKNIASENQGNIPLQFLIYDAQTKVWVQMNSKSHKVNVNENFVNYLEQNPEIDYKIYS